MNPEDIPAGLVERAAVAHVNHRRTSAGISPVDRLPWAHSSDVDRAHVRAALAAVWDEIQARTLEEAADRLEAYVTGKANVPDDDRWTIDIGYHGEAAWLCAEAERVRGDR